MASRVAPPRVALLAVLITVSVPAAIAMTPPVLPVAAWWPASALGVCLLLLTDVRRRLTFAGLLVVLICLGDVLAGKSWERGLVFGVCDAVEALLVVWMLTRGNTKAPSLRTFPDLGRLLVAGAVGSIVAAVAVGLSVRHEISWETAGLVLALFCAHLAGDVIIIPIALTRTDGVRRARSPEIVVHVVFMAGTALVIYLPGQNAPLPFVLFLFLVWAAARFTPIVNTAVLILLWIEISTMTRLGGGPAAGLLYDDHPVQLVTLTQGVVLVLALVQTSFLIATAQERRVGQEVRRNEQRMRRVLESARGTAMMATDTHGRITWFSPGAEQLLGYGAQDLVGTHTLMVLFPAQEVRERAEELGIAPGFEVFTHGLDDGADSETRDWTCVRRDRSRRLTTVTVTAIAGPDHSTTGYVVVIGNVSDQREADLALLSAMHQQQEANSRRREAEQVKSDFVSLVSHELRTPITSIVGYTELLDEGLGGELNPSQRDIVERIDRNGHRLLRLIEDLLALSHLESGTIQFPRVPLDLRSPVAAAADEVSARLPGLEITMTVDLPDTPVTIDGDTDQLERLLFNLLSNALKFTEAGGHVGVRLRVVDGHADLVVEDDGIGIPAAEQEQLFNRFFRASTARSSEIQGTGLGLSIVQSIAQSHDGRVEISSTEGVGTTIRVVLPTATSPGAEDYERADGDAGDPVSIARPRSGSGS